MGIRDRPNGYGRRPHDELFPKDDIHLEKEKTEMKHNNGWIRIACVCILILGLIGCSGSCAGKTDGPIETVPASEAPQNIETDTIDEDTVVSQNPNDGTEAQPTLPAGSDEATEAPQNTEDPNKPDPTDDPLEFEVPIPTATPTPAQTPTLKPGETARPTDVPTPTPEPTAEPTPTSAATPDNSPIELPELP